MKITSKKPSVLFFPAAASLLLLLVVALANAGTASALSCSNCVTSGDIVNSTISYADLASNSVKESEISSSAVGSSELASNSVNASEIITGAVGSSELADDITVNTLTANAIFASSIFNTDFLNLGSSVVTPILDNGEGTPVEFTLSYADAWAFLGIDCQDTDGCNVTLEQDFTDGDVMFVYSAGVNPVNFSDTTEQSELAGNFTMGQWDTLQVIFRDDTLTNSWIEVSRSDN